MHTKIKQGNKFHLDNNSSVVAIIKFMDAVRRYTRIYIYSAYHLLACWFAVPISSTLKMETICSSETSVETQRTTRRHIPEDDTLHVTYCFTLANDFQSTVPRTPNGFQIN
jgi:hypothetical protein